MADSGAIDSMAQIWWKGKKNSRPPIFMSLYRDIKKKWKSKLGLNLELFWGEGGVIYTPLQRRDSLSMMLWFKDEWAVIHAKVDLNRDFLGGEGECDQV